MNHLRRYVAMNRHGPVAFTTVLLAAAVLVGACGSSSGPLGSVPVASGSPEPSVAQGSPDLTPAPSDEPTTEPSESPGASLEPASAPPSAAPSGTTIVRAYFWLGGEPDSDGLVATLREIPATKGVATAAVNALLAGPTTGEAARDISSAVPAGSKLLGLAIDGGVATVNLSSEFESGAGSASVLTRLGQMVYTLTQFPTVKSVVFEIEGVGRTVFSS